ncbi:type II toxin-antitoxin system RelE/ParE family toxin [Runella sp.]|jgi:plasmid stabilization system protein ParE|uniref:type II toxin-antitoxin system RelE/ParE family toxin n=1 Tax=Runella sp. TaxID=1960881 RepID=UPI0026095420|nr:type II toxin-antitoxin system RelE/ParE family toxin [Runella sp.]
MELTVELSERARRDIEQIADYLAKNWSERTKIEFLILLTEQMKLISTMLYLYKASQKQFNVRECVMNKHTVLYYRVSEETIEIITIRNTRQKPEEF